MKRTQDTYGEAKTFVFPNAIARVRSPILTDEERARRMEQIAQSAWKVIEEYERKKN
jgi:hypothetical protein